MNGLLFRFSYTIYNNLRNGKTMHNHCHDDDKKTSIIILAYVYSYADI